MFILSFLCSFIISIIFYRYLEKKEWAEKLELCNDLFKPTFLRIGDKLIISKWNGIGLESNKPKLYRCSITGYAGKYGRIDFEISYDDLSSEEIKLIMGKPGVIFNPSHGSIMFFEFFTNLDCHFIVDKETIGDAQESNKYWCDVFPNNYTFTPSTVVVDPIVKIWVTKVIKSQLGILGGVYFFIEDITFGGDKNNLVMTVSVNFNRGDKSVSTELAKILESYIAKNLTAVRENWLMWHEDVYYVKPISVKVVDL